MKAGMQAYRVGAGTLVLLTTDGHWTTDKTED
jgi:hypothetical protein